MPARTAGPGCRRRPGAAGTVPYRVLLVALREFLRTDGEVYLDDPNVSSIGIGYKATSGRRTPELCVQFTVHEKHGDAEALAALGTTPVPPTLTIAGIDVPTDVVQR
ncbi:MAG: DNA/RNA non-specific endonuclease, partial [Actinomycetes bacterium]